MREGTFLSGLVLVIISIPTFASPPAPQWEFAGSQTNAAAVPASSGPILDQSQTTSYGGGFFWADKRLAQTFTPSITGTLDHLEAFTDNWDNSLPSSPLNLQIVDTINGVPSGPILASVDFPPYINNYGWN